MYTAMQIARYIINLCYNEKRPVSNLELQKILYFLQVYYMRHNNGTPLFSDLIYAWPYGPVIPDVYYTFNGYGGGLIRNSYDVSDITQEVRDLLRPIILYLEQKGPWTLVDMSHLKGGPWDQVFRGGIGDREVIDISLLQSDQNEL